MTYDLLPAHSTPLERAFDEMAAGRLALPLHLTDLHRPWHVSSALLPFAAFGRSTDLWEPEWAEERQRRSYGRAIAWHRMKGTAAALREAVEAYDGEVRSLIVPPANTYLMPALTEEERRAFLARFAQIRIFPFVERDLSGFYCYTSAAFGLSKAFMGDAYLAQTGSRQRYRREAFLWDRGVSTPLTTREMQTFRFDGEAVLLDEIALAEVKSPATFPGGTRSFCGAGSTAGRKLVQVPRSLSYSYEVKREAYTTTLPDGAIIQQEPDQVFERHPTQAGAVYPGDRPRERLGFLPPTISWQFIYQVLYLHDPDRAPDQRTRALHLGYTRLSMPSFTAEVRVRVTGREPTRRARRFVAGYFAASDPRAQDGLLRAVRSSLSLRDRVLLTTKTFRTIRAGDRLKPGEARAGQMIEV